MSKEYNIKVSLRIRTQVAEKEHTCSGCKAKIKPGDEYSTVYDGRISSKACQECVRLLLCYL